MNDNRSDPPKDDPEIIQTTRSATTFSTVVKKKCSVIPNCGYLEIRSTSKTHCKRTTCNYYWTLNADRDDEELSKKLEKYTAPCCDGNVKEKYSTIRRVESEVIVNRRESFISNLSIQLNGPRRFSAVPEMEIGSISYGQLQIVASKTDSNKQSPTQVSDNKPQRKFSKFYETYERKQTSTQAVTSKNTEKPSMSPTTTVIPSTAGPVDPRYCTPTTCDKLNPKEKKRTCCEDRHCPVNDPNSSTYKFLLKVRMCCKKRGCQLAARICDIYEPLVNVDVGQSPDQGEEKYHYLGKDRSTAYEEIAAPIETNEKWLQLQENREISDENSVRDFKKPDAVDIDILRDSVYVEPEKKDRRTSTVSWHVSRTASSEDQLVVKATEDANRFRQAQQVNRAGSLFGTIIREQEKDKDIVFDRPEGTVAYQVDSKDLLFKSQLDTIQITSSDHKNRCWILFKQKLKRKKKLAARNNKLSWPSNTDIADRKRLNIDAPIEEQQMEISNMLNKM